MNINVKKNVCNKNYLDTFKTYFWMTIFKMFLLNYRQGQIFFQSKNTEKV